MKVVLSRKGFDSSIGKCASPILPNGELLSLPIPTRDKISYDELRTSSGLSYKELIGQLGAASHIQGKGAHLDPDLVPQLRPRLQGWRPSLGQIGAAAGHLRNQKVGVGDLFLFYGWFRQTELVEGRLQYVSSAPNLHVIYGYLRVGEVLAVDEGYVLPQWLRDHPHADRERRKQSTNTLYLAAPKLGSGFNIPGASVLSFKKNRVLTVPGMTRGKWVLPGVLRDRSISYHTADAWKDEYFQSYSRAQEYVIDADRRVVDWALGLIGG